MSTIESSKSPAYDTFKSGGGPERHSAIRGAKVGVSTIDVSSNRPICSQTIVVIESRVLVRDCLVRAIQAANELNLVGVANVDDALEVSAARGADLFLLSLADPLKIVHHAQNIARLISERGAPVTVLGDDETFDEIAQMFDMGVVGYISTDLSAEVVGESLRLVLAGGKFVPASVLVTARFTNCLQTLPLEQYKGMFTERQIGVLEALSLGKANKVIANELKMKEGTVKVYVRNLMRRLKARNRTELALIVAEKMRPKPTHKSICS
jgi:DNA-binding NarL/FixJ family response regulator